MLKMDHADDRARANPRLTGLVPPPDESKRHAIGLASAQKRRLNRLR
jgi:hypothetical protein